MHDTRYPPARTRSGPALPVISELYGRIESTQAEVALTDTDADVMLFSGTPALIVLTARTNGALFTLTDRLGTETHEVAVLPNQTIEVRVQRDRVIGRNLVAGSAAAVYVVGHYAATREPVHVAAPMPPGTEPAAIPAAIPPYPVDQAEAHHRGSSPCTRGFRV